MPGEEEGAQDGKAAIGNDKDAATVGNAKPEDGRKFMEKAADFKVELHHQD